MPEERGPSLLHSPRILQQNGSPGSGAPPRAPKKGLRQRMEDIWNPSRLKQLNEAKEQPEG